jgi:hypothetical protein
LDATYAQATHAVGAFGGGRQMRIGRYIFDLNRQRNRSHSVRRIDDRHELRGRPLDVIDGPRVILLLHVC